MRSVLALSAFAFLASTSIALADPAPGTIMKVTPPADAKTQPAGGGKVDPAVVCTQKYRMQASQLTQLGAMLKLTETQKPVFASWRKVRLDMFQAVPCPEPSFSLDVPAPKRVENEIAILSVTLDGLRKELPATQTLYAALTPEQRAIFDGPIRSVLHPPAAPAPAPSH